MSEPFSMRNLADLLSQALLDTNETHDVCMETYLDSFVELQRFTNALGSMFSYVGKDLHDKTNIIRKLLTEDDVHYKTASEMLEYEKSNGLLKKTCFVSGSRTLLRLNRGLNFVCQFLDCLGKMDDTDDASKVCREVYERSLAPYHGLLVRVGARLGISGLPCRGELLNRMCPDANAIAEALRILPDAVSAGFKVHGAIDDMYTLHSLHDLP